jgi:hypothetical protein
MADQVIINAPSILPAEPEGDLTRLTDEHLEQLEQPVNAAHGEASHKTEGGQKPQKPAPITYTPQQI